MLSEIGFMVGCYIITKLIYICGQKETGGLVKAFSGVTILVSILVMTDLLIRGTSGIPGAGR